MTMARGGSGPVRWARRELGYLLAAIQFLTRFPVPTLQGFEPVWLARASGYFPLAGLLVGAVSATVLLSAAFVLPGPLPAILAIAVGILATGAFHEDGLADTFDGLGGGQTRSQRLAIMKDSRIGTYGVAALVSALAMKAASLAALTPDVGALALLSVHAGGRMVPVAASAVLPYGGETAGAKVAPIEPPPSRLLLALLTGLAPFLALPFGAALAALGAGILASSLILWWAMRAIGGQTGDVLGAAEQAFEVAVLVVLAGALGM